MKHMQSLLKLSFALAVFAPVSTRAGTLTTIYRFDRDTKVEGPTGPLVYLDGAIYGTSNGATSTGSVYKFDLVSGLLSVIYTFQAGADGQYPVELIYHDGTFYGTTNGGGNTGCGGYGCGTVFALDPATGSETVLYRFLDPGTGGYAGPGGLVYHDGTLYGTTYSGGGYGSGSVFAVNVKTGVETDLYSFSYDGDGFDPRPTLLYENGLLYGVTSYGGTACANHDCGTVFSVNPATGAEETLHTFASGTGGYNPYSNLIEHNGLIYGSTNYGGDLSCGKGGCGTIFSIDPATGAYNVVETLVTNHQHVLALKVHGNDLYETVEAPNDRRHDASEGQLAKLSLKTAKRTVLYKFNQGINGAEGAQPYAPLVYAHGVFYGSTTYGGETGGNCTRYGCGTLFQYVP